VAALQSAFVPASMIPRDGPLHLGVVISMPGVPNGLAAILFCTGTQPNCLEIPVLATSTGTAFMKAS
jgi:hypothetical protein